MFKVKHKHEPKKNELVYMPEDFTFENVKIEIHGMDNFKPSEQEKFMKAVHLGNEVLNSVNFKTKMIMTEFAENKGMNGKRIWEVICTGKDLYNPTVDRDIDVFITMYHNFWTGNIGYTFPDTMKTWINRVFFSKFNEAEVIGNVLHEAMHNFGFDHLNPETRQQSVPYGVGYIVRDLANEVREGRKLISLKVG